VVVSAHASRSDLKPAPAEPQKAPSERLKSSISAGREGDDNKIGVGGFPRAAFPIAAVTFAEEGKLENPIAAGIFHPSHVTVEV
jgi:hypothetical protein